MKKIIVAFIMSAIFSTVCVFAATSDYEFETNYAGITVTDGNNTAVENGRLVTTCTNRAVTFSASGLSVANKGYIVFSLKSSEDVGDATVQVTANNIDFTTLALKGTDTCVFALNLNDLSSKISSFSIKVDAKSDKGNKIYFDYIRFPASISLDFDTEKYCTVFSSLREKINVTTKADNYAAFVTTYTKTKRFSGASKFYDNIIATVSEGSSFTKVFMFESDSTLVPLGEAIEINLVCGFSEWV